MSETPSKSPSSHPRITECPIRAFEQRADRNPLPAAGRMTVVQDLARGSRTLQEASRAISSCCADGDLAQVRPDGRIYLVDATLSDETLVDLARAYTSETDDVDGELLGAINARVQQLRNGGDP